MSLVSVCNTPCLYLVLHRKQNPQRLLFLDLTLLAFFLSLFTLRALVGLNANRSIEGTLRGYDQFMNVVLDDCVEIKPNGDRRPIGMSVIRGNSILTMETLLAPKT